MVNMTNMTNMAIPYQYQYHTYIYEYYFIILRRILAVQNQIDALNLNLKEISVLDEDITLFEWLRRRDYAGITYDNDFDYE